MNQNSIQCVLNSGLYIQDKVVHVGGSNKDFYVNNYDGFVRHISVLSSGIDDVQKASRDNRYSRITYAKVRMREDAITKSYRPTKSLFTRGNRSTVVGGMGLGELLVEFRPESFDKINGALSRAQNERGEKVSRVRSEVGSIQDIVPYDRSDRMSFDFETVLQELAERHIIHFYVELFHSTEAINRIPMDINLHKLIDSFLDALDAEQEVEYRSLPVSGSGGLVYLTLSESKNQGHTKEFLTFLSEHPLVRKVHVAPTVSVLNASTFIGNEVNLTRTEDFDKMPKVGIIDGGVSDDFKDWTLCSHGFIPNRYRDEAHGSKVAGLLIKGNYLNGTIICPGRGRVWDRRYLPLAG